MREEPGPPSVPWHMAGAGGGRKKNGKKNKEKKKESSSWSPARVERVVMAERSGRDVPVPPRAAERMHPWTTFTWASGFFGVQNPAPSPGMLLAVGASQCCMEVV